MDGKNVKWLLSRKKIEKYGVAAAVIGGVSVIGAVLFAFSQAATGPRLYVTPETQTVTSGSNLSVTVRADSLTEKVNSVQASLGYDANQLQFVGLSETGPFSLEAASDTATPGVIRIARAVPSGSAPVSGDQAVVTLNFTVLASSGTIALTFNTEQSMLVRASDSTNILSGTNGGSYTVSGGGSQTASMTLSPATTSVAADQTFTVTIKENSGTTQVNSVQSYIGYDPAKLQFVSLAEGTVFPTVAATETTTPGLIKVARSVESGSAGVSGTNDIVTITFRMLATSGSTDITIDKANSFVVTSADNQDILGTVAGSGVSVSTTSSGSATLSMTPVDGQLLSGTTVSVAIKVNSPAAKVTTIQSTFSYPAAQLEFIDATNSSVFPTAMRTKASGGVVEIIRGVSGGNTGVTGENLVVTVNFRVIGTTGAAALTFANTSAVYDNTGTGVSILNLSQSTGANYTLIQGGSGGGSCTEAPSTPGVPSATTTDYTNITFGWTASTAGANCTLGGYKILRSGTVIATVTSGTTYTDSGLTAGTSYSYSVQAYDTLGHESVASAPASVSTKADDQSPLTPTGLTATAPDAASVALNWTASTDMPNPGGSGTAGYHIYRNNATSPTYTVHGVTSYTDTNVTAGTSYSYSIRAFDKVGNASAPSNVVTVQTQNPAPTCSANPSVPSALTTAGVTMTSVSLNWNASTAAENCTLAGYKIYRGTALVGTVTGTAYTENGLTAGVSYTYTVKAYDTSAHHSADSAPVTAQTTADTTAPTGPSGLTATAVSAGRVDLAWSASTDDVAVTGYRLYRNGSLYRSLPAHAVSYSDTLVSGSTDYSYQISAIDAAGNESARTNAAPTPVRTPEAADTQAPTTPTNLRRLTATTSSISLAWDGSTDNKAVAGYHVYRNGQFLRDVTVTAFTDSGLPTNTTYTYVVRAFDASGNSSASSNSLQAATLAPVATQPQPQQPRQPQQSRPRPRPPVQTVRPIAPAPTVPLPISDEDVIETETPIEIQPITIQPDGISKIEYHLNNKLVKTVNTAPYKYKIDTTQLLDGKYRLMTKTYYTNGTVDTTNQTLIVDNKFGLTQMRLIAQKYAMVLVILFIILTTLTILIIRKARSGSSGNGGFTGGTGSGSYPGSGPVVTPTSGSGY